MKKLTKLFGSFAGILLTASSVLADTNVTSASSDHIFGLGPILSQIYNNVWLLAGILAGMSLLFIWSMSHLDTLKRKVSNSVHNRENIQNWFIDCVLVVLGFIFLNQWVIPTLKTMTVQF
jgi:high-affinity Fe2+/Pb2+ permease